MDKNISLYSLILQNFIDRETIQKIKPDTLLFQEDENVQNVYVILSGSVSVGRVHMKGKEFILKILNGEEMIIEYELFKHNPRYHFSAKTLTECEIMLIKIEQFEEFILKDKTAMNAMVNWLSTR